MEGKRAKAALLALGAILLGVNLRQGARISDLEGREAECRTGDTLEMFFTCRDACGLRYLFPLASWEIDAEGKLPVTAPASHPVLGLRTCARSSGIWCQKEKICAISP